MSSMYTSMSYLYTPARTSRANEWDVGGPSIDEAGAGCRGRERTPDRWQADHNNFRPHGSLARSTPTDFAAGALHSTCPEELEISPRHRIRIGVKSNPTSMGEGREPKGGLAWLGPRAGITRCLEFTSCNQGLHGAGT